MPKRKYFYKDKTGAMQKYIYCDMCPTDKSQPYTADQEYNPQTREGLFITCGTHIAMCVRCAKTLGVIHGPAPEPISFVGPSSVKKQKSTAAPGKIIKRDMEHVRSAQKTNFN